MPDTSIKETHNLVKYMEKMSFVKLLKVARNIIVIGVTLALMTFLVGFAWNKASPPQPPAQIIINNS
jgi:hypothetical protein